MKEPYLELFMLNFLIIIGDVCQKPGAKRLACIVMLLLLK